MPRVAAPTLAGLCALGLATGVAVTRTAPASAATTNRCARVKDMGPTGADPADAVGIRATRTSCATARSIARRWGRETVRQSSDVVRIGSYRCRDAMSTRTGRISVRCAGPGSRLVRFRLG
jgi:hypothetical protein